MAKIAVLLSGCGHMDGSEIHEATCALLALDAAGAEVVCCAPDAEQADVTDHVTRKPSGAPARNMLIEAARIARGNIVPVGEITPEDFDALVIPGGLGAARNLCDFAATGADCTVRPDVERLIGSMLDAGKPVGAICIAPALLARVCGRKGIEATLTIGDDPATAAAIERMGATHAACRATDAVCDEPHKVVSTPAYMLARGPAEVYQGVTRLVEHVLRLAGG